jgi:hypothetical protein
VQVRFSRPFTEEEVTDRWRALLFDKKIGKAAAIRMGKAERVPRPPPLIGDDMQTIVAAWRNARAAAGEAGGAAPPAEEPPTFSEVRILRAAAHASLWRLTPRRRPRTRCLRWARAACCSAPPGTRATGTLGLKLRRSGGETTRSCGTWSARHAPPRTAPPRARWPQYAA